MSELYGIEALIAGQMAGKKADDREFPFTISDTDPVTISCTNEELIEAIDAGKTPIGYWRHTQSNGTVIRLFHLMKRFDVADGTNLTFYFSDKTSSGVLDVQADGTIKRTYQNNDGGGASGSANFTFTITPVDGQVSPNLSATRAEMLSALDAGKTLLGYWMETRTILETTDTIKHEFRLESVNGAGASRGLAFVNYEQFYKSTLYVNGNDTVSFVDKERLPIPMTKTEAMTQSVGMDDDGRLWTEPGASGLPEGATANQQLVTTPALTKAWVDMAAYQYQYAFELVPAQVLSFVTNEGNVEATVPLDENIPNVMDSEATCKFDNVEYYLSISVDENSGHYIGTKAILSGGTPADGEPPFVAHFTEDGLHILTTAGAGAHSISIVFESLVATKRLLTDLLPPMQIPVDGSFVSAWWEVGTIRTFNLQPDLDIVSLRRIGFTQLFYFQFSDRQCRPFQWVVNNSEITGMLLLSALDASDAQTKFGIVEFQCESTKLDLKLVTILS